VIQIVEYLLSKLQALSSNPSVTKKKKEERKERGRKEGRKKRAIIILSPYKEVKTWSSVKARQHGRARISPGISLGSEARDPHCSC
jgi:hypothetical protein